MEKRRSYQTTLIWEMHRSGMAISEISASTHLDESFVRATITDNWRRKDEACEAA